MSVADSAVGAILEIPPSALQDIQKAEKAIWSLHDASKKAADQIYGDFSKRMPMGIDVFINKLAEARGKMEELSNVGMNFNVNTESATQQMSNFTEKVQSDSSKVSQSIQEIASTPIDAKGVKEYAEAWNLTFQDVQDKIKALRNGLKVQATEGQGAQVQLQAIKAWEDYYKSVSKVNEETNKHGRVVNELKTKINDVQQAIDHENATIARFSQKVQDAWTAVNAFKSANPNFNVDKAEQQLESLRGKIQRLYEQLNGGGLTDKKENRIIHEIDQLKTQAIGLDNTIATCRRVYRELAEAEDAYESRANNGSRVIGQRGVELRNLATSLQKAEQAQALFNAELEKGNTAKSLASEYAKLTKRLQEVNDAMNKFQAAGGNVNSASFQALQNEWQNIMARRKEIEKMDIAEVNQYRQQMTQSAYQADLSAFVQAEVQKTAEAKKQADERARQQAESQQKYLNSAQGAMWYSRQLNKGNIDNSYENRERAIKQLESAIKSLDKNDKDYDKTLEKLTRTLNILKNAQKEVSDAMKPTKHMVSPQDAINAAKTATTLRQLEAAYKALKDAMSTADPKSQKWADMNTQLQNTKTSIDEIRKKMGELKDQHVKLSGIVGQLRGQIVGAFSIGAINGFIKKMVEVRAQFELQRVALGAIIQDRDEANKIFTQVQNMALESPFNIMQLEKATKQIAAFGFETKKLVPTMKMFADISAGLGVEIDRLVLVMGHLKARNFLEGCLGLGTPVKMADGSVKRVEDILQGECIMGDDDTPRIIKQVIRGNEQMYKVRYTDGSFRCNEKHILTLFNTEKNVIEDVYVLDYIEAPETYKGVRRLDGRFEYFDIAVTKDIVDDYYGFVIDGNRRFQLGDGTVTHNTMVRQFTNMGFNILGELSKYYSELENRMVSVAEVQDRVKKKMISFEDVEEVLKRVTSAGGMFYDMQKKQSDSLWGQMQRITDAYDLMLNEIGQSNEGVIKSALSAIRDLIKAWRTLKPFIVAAVAAMGSYMVVATGYKVITLTLNGMRLAYIALTQSMAAAKAQAQALNITMMSNPWAAAAAAIVGLIVYIYQATTATSKLNEEMSRIGSDMTDSLNESIATFHQLAKTITDTNSTYTERTEAMDEMKRVYADILPKEKLEIAYIQSLNGNYAELTKTIQEYYQQKEYNQKLEAIQGSDEAQALQKQWEETLTEMNDKGMFDLKYSKAQIKSWAETLSKEMTSGKLNASIESLDKRIKGIFNAKDLSSYWNETYGVADMHDILQAYQKVADAQGEITIETANAENATKAYQDTLKHFDLSQLSEAKKSLQEQKDIILQSLESGVKGFSGTAGGRPIYGTMQMDDSDIEEYKARLKAVEDQIQAVQEAEEQWLANQFKEEVDKQNESLTSQYKAYWELNREMQSLQKNGKLTKEKMAELQTKMNDAKESAEKLRKKFGLGEEYSVANGFLDSAETSYELEQKLNTLTKKAFPKVAEIAMKAMSAMQKAFLEGKVTLLGWLKDVADIMPDVIKENIPGLNDILSKVDAKLKLSQQQLKALGEAANEASNDADKAGRSFDEIVNPKLKQRVSQFGADMKEINSILAQSDKTGDGAAKDLRGAAKRWDEMVHAYKTVADKNLWLELNNQTKESMALMEQNSKAAKQLATDLAGEDSKSKSKKGSKGKDEIAELWKNRLKAIQDFYKRYEELRKHFDETESLKRAKDAFQGLFNVLNMDMNGTVAKGMNKQGLADNIKEMLDIVKVVRPKLADEFSKAFADTQIQVDFKIKEDSEKQLKSQLDEMFANYELTEELKKIGVSVDLTYMVGGKPTTKEDIRKEIERLRAEGGGDADAENRIKILEEYEKKLTQIELKEQKERLKNYEKYLKQMYSDRAKKMIEAYSTYYQMEEDFQKNIQTLQEEMNSEGTTDARKKELAELIKSLQTQADEAAKGIKDALEKELNALDWNQFKSSPIFSQMYQDMDTLGKKGIDALIIKLEDMRKKLQSASNVDMKAVREVTQYIEKLKEAKINLQPFTELKSLMKDVNKLRKEGITYEQALLNLINTQNTLNATNNEISDLEAIIGLKDKGVDLDKDSSQLTSEQKELYAEHKADLQGALNLARERVKAEQDAVDVAKKNVDTYNKTQKAIKAQIALLEQLKSHVLSIVNSCFEIADAVGGVVDEEWKNLTTSIVDATFQAVILTLQFKLMGIALNSAMGIIGYIAIALQVVASLFTAIFAAKDKRLQKKIEGLQDRVDTLSKAFERLQKSIERAFNIGNENRLTEQALDNLEAQKRAYQEMIRLEEAKKKTDDDKIKDYKDKLEELAEAEEELYEKRHEKWGSTNNVWDEANNWVDAWFHAYKENGDGLDALNDSWDEFYENLVKKQAASKVLGARMDSWVKQINDAIDKNMGSEYDYIDLFKQIGEEMKAKFDATNEDLKKIFEYAGIGGGAGSLILSDLQKGIQNITEPQAAAIEAYLNSMRFAVFDQNAKLDALIATIQMQYGSGAENPVVTELKGIRGVLDNIYRDLHSVVKSGVGKTYIQVG